MPKASSITPPGTYETGYHLTDDLTREAIRYLAEIGRRGHQVSFALNLSGHTFSDPDLLARLRREIAAAGVDASRLIFEITETAAVSDFEQARAVIVAIKSLGCRFALDDFGIGFSSFTYLRHFPVDYLKLDGSFIRQLPDRPEDQAIVRALHQIATGFGKRTIAEYVETEATLSSLVNCCQDLSRARRVVLLDAGVPEADRAELLARFPFVEFGTYPPGARIEDIRRQADTRFLLHLGRGCRLFAPEPLLGRLAAVLEAEPDVVQVGINLDDATQLTGRSAAESSVRRTEAAGRYVVGDRTVDGPAMFDTGRLDRLAEGDMRHTATLDEVLCIIGR